VNVIARPRIREYQARYPECAGRLSAWYDDMSKKNYGTFEELRQAYQQADQVGERVVFNIGRSYRLVVRVNWKSGTVFVRWFGPHAEYDRTDVSLV
jgi:mRNA interferase HigB